MYSQILLILLQHALHLLILILRHQDIAQSIRLTFEFNTFLAGFSFLRVMSGIVMEAPYQFLGTLVLSDNQSLL